MESLSNEERLVIEVARMLREDFLFQDAFSPDDAYTPLDRQYGILKSIMTFYEAGLPVVTTEEFEFDAFTKIPSFATVPVLKDKLDWTIEDFASFQDSVRADITGLTATAA
jgi:V/A-type H+-transporting ATPase subunit A